MSRWFNYLELKICINKVVIYNYICCFYKSINLNVGFFNVSDDGGIYFEFFDRYWFCGDGCGL